MSTTNRPQSGMFTLVKMVCIVCVFCAAVTIAMPAQTFTTLHSFAGYPTEGSASYAGLVQGNDGSLYGTTGSAGANDAGTVFRITPEGTLTTLYSFCDQPGCIDGSFPYAGLLQGSDGNLYGTTIGGGVTNDTYCSMGCGTAFKITPGGTLTTLYSFCSQSNCTDGVNPFGVMVQATDGNFYGTTAGGGTPSQHCGHGCGTVFKITPEGTLTTLHSFVVAEGAGPLAGLVQAADGNFYGTASVGGTNNDGTVFKITPGGMLTTLHIFDATDGDYPEATLVQAPDGNFYGTTVGGGANRGGTVFKIAPGGTLITIYSFCSQSNCTDGSGPDAGVVQATNGNFYGTTPTGGGLGENYCVGDCGTIFTVTPGGTLTTLHSFQYTDGANPHGRLVQATDGNFYGTTFVGGTASGCCGTVYKLSVGLGPFVETQPTSGTLGTPVTILGTNLTGSTSVTFNGTAATFNVVSPSEITTTVPPGATTGTVQVTTPGGTLTSNSDFQVTEPLQFVPVTPCRLVDTRQTGGPIQGGTSRNFSVPQLGGCNIPTSAAAYSLNVTVVPPGPLGYLTIWAQGEIEPFVSTMNSLDGRTKATAAIVPAGNNAVSVYVSDTSNVVLDIDGYFPPVGDATLAFYPLPPCRVADTRKSSFPDGLDVPHLSQGVARDFPMLESSCIPIGVLPAAYSLNFTAIPYPALGSALAYLEVWPTGEQPQHPVSTLNNPTGTYVANAAIVTAGTDGKITAFGSDDTDLAIDIDGYFAAPGTGGLSLYPTVPCRVFDTRTIGNGQPFSGTLTPPVDVVDSSCGVPNTAQAYVFNATVVPSPNLSYLTLWPDSQEQPAVSTLNAADGWITSNMAIVPNVNGKIDAYAAGLTQLILDISSYFAP